MSLTVTSATGDKRRIVVAPPTSRLEAVLRHKNPFIRKGTALAMQVPRTWKRLRASSENYLVRPPLLVNSFPKSGTHLLDQIVRAFPECDDFGTFLATCPSVSMRPKSATKCMSIIERFVPGEIVRAHLYFCPAFVDSLSRKNVVNFFIWRDPRDVVVSEAHYLRFMNRWHRLHPYFKKLESIEDSILLSIRGLEPTIPGVDYPNVGERFRRYGGWLHDPATCSIRFENLIGKEREQAVRGICEFFSRRTGGTNDVEEMVVAALTRMQPQRSHTYRDGKSGGWRQSFTAQHKAEFKSVAGDLLVELGCEQDHHW